MSSGIEHKRPESVLVVVHTATGRALLLRRADNPEFWQSVTGSMEWQDDSPLATALRELREETGIVAAPAQLRDWGMVRRYRIYPQWRHRYAPGVSENTEHAFSLQLPDQVAVTLSPAEHSEYVWVPIEDAAARVFSWTNREALEAIISERAISVNRHD